MFERDDWTDETYDDDPGPDDGEEGPECPDCGGSTEAQTGVFVCCECGTYCDEEGEYIYDGLTDAQERAAERRQMGIID